jgi:hypothetical protein
MRNLSKNTIQAVAALLPLTLASALLGAAAITASSNLPTDLTAIPTSIIPDNGIRVYGLAQWPLCPPLPGAAWMRHTNLQFYYSTSYDAVFMDNREEVATEILLQAAGLGVSAGDTLTPDFGFGPLVDYSSNTTDLWLSIPWSTNTIASNQVAVLLHNTTNTLLYNLVTHSNFADGLSCTNWPSQAVLWGAANTNVTATTLQMDGTSNLFFWAYSITNEPITVWLDSTRYSTGFVNSVSNFFGQGDTVTINPVLHSLVMGYDGSDRDGVLYPNGDPFPFENLAAQGVIGISLSPNARLSISNLFLSNNTGLGSLDIASSEKLTDVECYGCSSLTSVSVTNCPSLTRACFENCNLQNTLDLSGCAAVVDIRCARNYELTNFYFGPNGPGPNVRHLCVHHASSLNSNLALTNFYALQELFLNDCNQTGDFTPVSTNLLNVWAWNNAFTSANFGGQMTLTNLQIENNSLTNLIVNNSPNLIRLEAQLNHLPSQNINDILVQLDASAANIKYVDLTGPNNGFASGAGLTSYTNLINRNVTVYANLPGTNTWFGPTNAVGFVTKNSSHMQVTSPSSTVTWYCGNGASQTDVLDSVTTQSDFTCPYGIYTNYVVIAPPNSIADVRRIRQHSQGVNDAGQLD